MVAIFLSEPAQFADSQNMLMAWKDVIESG
jgi:hypothetical protein